MHQIMSKRQLDYLRALGNIFGTPKEHSVIPLSHIGICVICLNDI